MAFLRVLVLLGLCVFASVSEGAESTELLPPEVVCQDDPAVAGAGSTCAELVGLLENGCDQDVSGFAAQFGYSVEGTFPLRAICLETCGECDSISTDDEGPESAEATLGAYPDEEDAGVTGTVRVEATSAGLVISGVLSGLPATTRAGFHIHSGSSCATTDEVGGHWYESTGDLEDPWDTTYTSDASGYAFLDITLTAAELGYDPRDSLTLTVVAHSTDAKIACGVLSQVGAPTGPTTIEISWGFDTSIGSPIINVGDTVKWLWDQDDSPHDVTSGAGRLPDGLFASALQGEGEFMYTFDEEGEFPYFCSPHVNMVAVITVVALVEYTPPSCVDSVTFDKGFGGCSTYALGEENQPYCVSDGANMECPLSCGVCCVDSPDWESERGGCAAYAGIGQDMCDLDGAIEYCPASCGVCMNDEQAKCVNSDTFDVGFGGCETYDEGQDNHQYCAADGGFVWCPLACGTCVPEPEESESEESEECEDSATFDIGFGPCEDYVEGTIGHSFCAADGADDECPVACGMCVPPYDATDAPTTAATTAAPTMEGETPAPSMSPTMAPTIEVSLCVDSETFDIGYGGCENYAEDESEHMYCTADGADDECPVACGMCMPDGGACVDSETFDFGFGPCENYAEGESEHMYCAADGADDECPVACGMCVPEEQEDLECVDSDTFDIGFGGCEMYEVGASEHMYCTADGADAACPSACQTGCGECVDSETFDVGFGSCEVYAVGEQEHAYCFEDGADVECPLACGICEEAEEEVENSECVDSDTFDIGFGGCEEYIEEANKWFEFCEDDGADIACPVACGICEESI